MLDAEEIVSAGVAPSPSLHAELPRGRTWTYAVGAVVSLAVLVAAAYELLGLTDSRRLVGALGALAVCGWCTWMVARRLFGVKAEIGLWVAVAWLAVLTLSAILADVLPLAEARDPSKTLADPILLRPDLFSEHPLGTDRQALDLLGGVIYGARVSLVVGLGAVGIGILFGVPIGMLAGYFRRRTENVLDFFTNVMLAFPPIILLLAMVTVLRPSTTSVAIILGVLSIPVYIRIAKLNTMMYAERGFVLAAIVNGARARRILVRELLPCVMPPVLSYAVVVVAVAIVAEASLSFLGLGIQRPDPTWGNMIAAGQDDYKTNPHLVFVPGIVLVLTVLSLNHVNQVLRRRTAGMGAQL